MTEENPKKLNWKIISIALGIILILVFGYVGFNYLKGHYETTGAEAGLNYTISYLSSCHTLPIVNNGINDSVTTENCFLNYLKQNNYQIIKSGGNLTQ